jgi:hypothetical protein
MLHKRGSAEAVADLGMGLQLQRVWGFVAQAVGPRGGLKTSSAPPAGERCVWGAESPCRRNS